HHRTLTQALKDAGYDTAAFVYECGWLDRKYGFDRGFDVYEVSPANAERRTAAALEWLDRHSRRSLLVESVSMDTMITPNPLGVLLDAQQRRWTWQGFAWPTFRVRGPREDGVVPRLTISLDGRQIGAWEVPDESTPYAVPVEERKPHTITLTLTNPSTTAKPARTTSGAPVFLFVHYYDVHSDWDQLPYDEPAPYRTMFYPDYAGAFSGCEGKICASRYLDKLMIERRQLNDDDLRYLRALYAGGIRYTDTHV